MTSLRLRSRGNHRGGGQTAQNIFTKPMEMGICKSDVDKQFVKHVKHVDIERLLHSIWPTLSNSINYALRIAKLHSYGMEHKASRRFVDYLNKRCQRIKSKWNI